MTPRQAPRDAVLAGADAAAIRQALAACSNLLAWAGAHAGPDFAAAVLQASELAGRCRSPGGLYYDVTMAIDRLDDAARSTR